MLKFSVKTEEPSQNELKTEEYQLSIEPKASKLFKMRSKPIETKEAVTQETVHINDALKKLESKIEKSSVRSKLKPLH